LKLMAGHGSLAAVGFLRMQVGTMASTNGAPLEASQWSSKHSFGTSSGCARECQWQRLDTRGSLLPPLPRPLTPLLLVGTALALAAAAGACSAAPPVDSSPLSSLAANAGAWPPSAIAAGSSWVPGGVENES
jgi:hypothetical protein